MPSIPLLGSNGKLLDLVHATAEDVFQRSDESRNAGGGSFGPYGAAFDGHDFVVHASGLSQYDSINASAILARDQQRAVQQLATATSSISLVAALCAIYWFCMMRRNFRRDLVLLLIAGGFWKSLWFLSFSAATFTTGYIDTESLFCQVSGYMLQVGFEACGESSHLGLCSNSMFE